MGAGSSWGGLLAQRSAHGYGVLGTRYPAPEPAEEFRAAKTRLPVRFLARLAGTAPPSPLTVPGAISETHARNKGNRTRSGAAHTRALTDALNEPEENMLFSNL